MKLPGAVLFLPFSLLAQNGGISAEWDLRASLDALAAQTARLVPILEQVRPADWKGAPGAYAVQLNSARTQAAGLKAVVEALRKDPEKLTTALDVFLRIQSLDSVVRSVIEGVRKYQNPALADLLLGVLSEGGKSQLQLRQYVADLAQLKEAEFQVMEQEAQRCRSTLTRQPKTAKKPAEGTAQK
jgi:hypothetical protein